MKKKGVPPARLDVSIAPRALVRMRTRTARAPTPVLVSLVLLRLHVAQPLEDRRPPPSRPLHLHFTEAWSPPRVELNFGEVAASTSTNGVLLSKSFPELVWTSFMKHANMVGQHSAYIAAVAARGGRRLWAGRSLVAAFLLRFRLAAFTSEVGESLRPLIEVWQVRVMYAVSWLYVLIDIVLRTADEWALSGRTLRVVRTFAFFSIFHTVATMLLPAVIIHAAVHHADAALRPLRHLNGPSTTALPTPLLPLLRHPIVPTVVGLALIPLMPLLDEPVEALLKWAFRRLRRWKKLAQPPPSDYELATEAETTATTEDVGIDHAAPPPPLPSQSITPPSSEEPPNKALHPPSVRLAGV